jgi:hypothetical protein
MFLISRLYSLSRKYKYRITHWVVHPLNIPSDLCKKYATTILSAYIIISNSFDI